MLGEESVTLPSPTGTKFSIPLTSLERHVYMPMCISDKVKNATPIRSYASFSSQSSWKNIHYVIEKFKNTSVNARQPMILECCCTVTSLLVIFLTNMLIK